MSIKEFLYKSYKTHYCFHYYLKLQKLHLNLWYKTAVRFVIFNAFRQLSHSVSKSAYLENKKIKCETVKIKASGKVTRCKLNCTHQNFCFFTSSQFGLCFIIFDLDKKLFHFTNCIICSLMWNTGSEKCDPTFVII